MKKIEKLILEKKYSEFKKEILNFDAADIAEILSELNDELLIKFFRLLPKDIAAETFSFLELDSQQTIINSLTAKEAASIIDNMFADDATDLLEEMPANIIQKILSKTTPETRKDINQLLMYPTDSAGSIMTVEFMDIKDFMNVKDAINKVKKEAINKETIDFCYVIDKQRKLVGTISLKQLILANEDTAIKDIMEDNPIVVNTKEDQEEVANLFKKYDLTTMPVVDSENRLVGIITIDDIIDIIEEEASEDIAKISGMLPTEKPYLKLNLWDIYKSRMPWLLFLMISATFTGAIISHFEGALASAAVLTVFMPMVMGTGGNAGGQASVTIIRALSLNEIEFKDALRVILKESAVGLICGATLCICNFFKLLWFDKVGFMISLVVCISLFLTVLFAKIIGAILPILADKIKLDPAVMANPIITTIVDAGSLFVYFQVASMLLGL